MTLKISFRRWLSDFTEDLKFLSNQSVETQYPQKAIGPIVDPDDLLRNYRSAIHVANRLHDEVNHLKAEIVSKDEMIRNRNNQIVLYRQAYENLKEKDNASST